MRRRESYPSLRMSFLFLSVDEAKRLRIQVRDIPGLLPGGPMPDGCDLLGAQDIDQEQNGDHDDGEYDYRNPQSAFSLDQPIQGERIGTCKTEFAVLAGLCLLRADAAAVWAGLRKHSVRHCREITCYGKNLQ